MFARISKFFSDLATGVRAERAMRVVQESSRDLDARLNAIANLSPTERDAMAQKLDEAMRGNPYYEVARAHVLSARTKSTSEA